jgi:hypothetical protein
MKFEIRQALEILERTPGVLEAMLTGLSKEWLFQNEGGDTWSPYDVLGHLIHGEKTDWIPRLQIIMEQGTSRPFEPFDRFAQFEDSKGKSPVLLLEEFTRLRQENLRILKNTSLDDDALDRKGIHPAFGEVTLRQLLATWTAHDLSHIVQIARVMANQYKQEVGPWIAFLSVMK